MAIAGGSELLAGHTEHVGLQVGIGLGRGAARHGAAERCGRFDGERVGADVLGRQRDRLVQRPFPGIDRLAVRAVDQVEVHVVVPGGAGSGERGAHAVGRVQPFERRQHRHVERLGAHRQAFVPGAAQRTEGGFVHGVGVRLRGDLGVGRHVEGLAKVGQERREILRRLHRRRAAPEEHARDRPPRPTPGRRAPPRPSALAGSEVPGGPGRRRR